MTRERNSEVGSGCALALCVFDAESAPCSSSSVFFSPHARGGNRLFFSLAGAASPVPGADEEEECENTLPHRRCFHLSADWRRGLRLLGVGERGGPTQRAAGPEEGLATEIQHDGAGVSRTHGVYPEDEVVQVRQAVEIRRRFLLRHDSHHDHR